MIFSKIKDGGDALEARAITFESIFFIRQKESALSLDCLQCFIFIGSKNLRYRLVWGFLILLVF